MVIDTPGMRELECGTMMTELREPLGTLRSLLLSVNSATVLTQTSRMCYSESTGNGRIGHGRWQSYRKLKAENDYMEDKESYMIAKGRREKEISKLIKKMPIRV